MAIKPEELRLGNWVKIRGLYEVRVNDFIGREWFSYMEGQGCSYSDTEPISLTSDILLACGFEKQNNSNEFWNFWRLGSGWWIGESLHNEPSAGVEIGYCYWGNDFLKIDSLHHLMNLYFVLYKKELIYKP